jgi:hypothetical protein
MKTRVIYQDTIFNTREEDKDLEQQAREYIKERKLDEIAWEVESELEELSKGLDENAIAVLKENLKQSKLDKLDISDEEIYEEINEWQCMDYDDQRKYNLNKELDGKIVAIANIGLWNGRRSGYKMLGYNLNNILDYFSCDYLKVYADRYNVHSEASHHDGTHYVTFRMIKPNLSDEQVENFLNKVYNGTHTSKDITRYTKSLVKEVNKVYGW